MADHADTIVAAIKRPGRGAYLEALFWWAGIVDPFPTPAARASALLSSPLRHLTFETVQVNISAPPHDRQHDWDDIVLEQVVFHPEAEQPFHLDPDAETPDSAALKLATRDRFGGDAAAIARGDLRVSYFMFDATVCELTFRAGMLGYTRLLAARLG